MPGARAAIDVGSKSDDRVCWLGATFGLPVSKFGAGNQGMIGLTYRNSLRAIIVGDSLILVSAATGDHNPEQKRDHQSVHGDPLGQCPRNCRLFIVALILSLVNRVFIGCVFAQKIKKINNKVNFMDEQTIQNFNNRKNKLVLGGRSFSKGLLEFLKEYSVIGLAIGVIIAQTSKDLIDSIVKGLFTPFIDLLVPGQEFNNLKFKVADSVFDVGSIVSSSLTFFIVMIILYVVVKKLLKKDDLIKKP